METKLERSDYLLRQPKSEEVLNELIALNFGLLKAQLNKFYLYDDPDALSFAYEALLKAINTFDVSKNNKFSTYATVCIYNRLGSYIRSLHANQVELVYYEESVLGDDTPLINVIDSGVRTDLGVIKKDHIVDTYTAVEILVQEMTNPLQRTIIITWRNSGFSMTHENIAKDIGCTQSYVSQVLKKFFKKVKYKLEEIEHV